MNQYKNFSENLKHILNPEDIAIDEPMKNHTSFKVGGAADILVTPKNFDQAINVIKSCNIEKVPFYIIGNGSNLLVRDGGIRGVVIKLTSLNKLEVDGEKIIVESGAELSNVSKKALEMSLTGFEFACGIPGSVGGAVTMNAGAYISEIANVIEEAVVVDKEGNILRLNKEQLELGYRMSAVIKYGYTVLEATFKLQKGDYNTIKNTIEDLTRRREDKQPLEYPSAGSTFKRPTGYFAGKLIEDCGLKGFSIGDAEVSKKHSGFIINRGQASAKDILDLIKAVQDTVKESFGVELHTEVRIIGEDL